MVSDDAAASVQGHRSLPCRAGLGAGRHPCIRAMEPSQNKSNPDLGPRPFGRWDHKSTSDGLRLSQMRIRGKITMRTASDRSQGSGSTQRLVTPVPPRMAFRDHG